MTLLVMHWQSWDAYKRLLWPNDARVGGSPSMEEFMKMEEISMDENEDVIASLKLVELDQTNTRV